MEITLGPEKKIVTYDLLVLPPQSKPVYFIVKGMRFEGLREGTGISTHERKRFFYESHSCPTNWLQPELVYHDGNADPHGLIGFCSFVDASEMQEDKSNWEHHKYEEALIAQVKKELEK